MELSLLSKNSFDELKRLRRILHQNPELSGHEQKTSAIIQDYLSKLGLKFNTSYTGVFCDFVGFDKSKTVAFRCDFDALPIIEETKVDYASANGCMHACGHDGHTAILLVLASILKNNKPPFNVRLIFQFGEEGEGGAEKMIADGVIENVDEIYALHVDPTLEKGSLSTVEGAMFAGANEFNVEFFGKASHCAEPQKGKDAIKAMTHFLSNFSSLNEKYKHNSLLHVGKVSGGLARNIVADHVELLCSLRFFDVSQQEDIMMRTARLLNECDNLYHTTHKLTVGTYLPLINSPAAVKKIKKLCPDIKECQPRYTAEDFSAYLQSICGCMVWLGVKDERFSSPLHSPTFGFDEEALTYGLEFFLRILKNN